MEKIKEISVNIKYSVTIGDIDNVPIDVYNELLEAFENGDTIKPMSSIDEYPLASAWLSDNISESDCMEWECEINDLD